MRSDPDLPLLASTAFKRGFPLLRFATPLETAYQEAGAEHRQRVIGLGLIFSLPLYLLLLWVDHDMLPRGMDLAFRVRLGIYLPLLVLSGIGLFALRSARLREWMLAGFSTASCLLSMSISLGSEGDLRVQHLVILNAIVIYTVLFGRFWPMLAMSMSVFGMHLFAVNHLGALFSDIGVGPTLLLSANCTFMAYGCYLMEHASRTSFLVDLHEADMDAELADATEQLARIAREDALTGLANRRQFTEFLGAARERALADHTSLTIVLIDVDHFKAFNDHYGHPAGDECLRRVGQALRSAVRESEELVARWGGEEFAVVLPGVDEAAATQAAERLRHAVRACGIAHEASKTAPVVTASLGVAVLPADDSVSMADLIARADMALYVSKTSGRDRITVAPCSMDEARDVSLACDAGPVN